MAFRYGIKPETKELIDGEFLLIPEDRYHLYIEDASEKIIEGGMQVKVKYAIDKGDKTGQEYNGKYLYEYRRFMEEDSGRGYNKHYLHLLGVPYEGADLVIRPEEWVGKWIYGTVKHTTKDGKTFANVRNHEADGKEKDPLA